MKADNEWWRTADVARLLGVHRVTVTSWIKQGRLPGERISKLFRIHRDQLLAWCKEEGQDRAAGIIIGESAEAPIVVRASERIMAMLTHRTDIIKAACWFEAAVKCLEDHPRAVLMDAAEGWSEMITAARSFRGRPERPAIVGVLYDDQSAWKGSFDHWLHWPVHSARLNTILDGCRRK